MLPTNPREICIVGPSDTGEVRKVREAVVSSCNSTFTHKNSTGRSIGRQRGARRMYALALASTAVPIGLQVQKARGDIVGFGDGTLATGWQLNGSTTATPPPSGT